MSSVPGRRTARTTGCYADDVAASTAIRAAASPDLAEIEREATESTNAVDEFISNAISANTRRTYQGPQTRYTVFCLSRSIIPLPITADSVLLFLAHEASADFDKSSRTIGVYRSALSTMHEESKWGGTPNPIDDPRVARLLKGVKRAKAESDAGKRTAVIPTEVVTPSFLVEHEAYFGVGADSPDEIMKWAAMCLGTFGALRKSELLGSHFYPERRIRRDQLTFHRSDAAHTTIDLPSNEDVDSISHLSLQLGATKADPLARNPPLRIYSAVAIRAAWRWANIRASHRRTDLPHLFIDPSTRVHLTMTELAEFVSRMFVDVGRAAPKITGKAFRKGAASELVSSGIPNSVGADLGRWKTASMVDVYATPAARADRYERMSRTLGLPSSAAAASQSGLL